MIQVVITNIGREKLINAKNNGTANIEISKVSFGGGKYTADATASALNNEFKVIDDVSGSKIDASTIELKVSDSSDDEYLVSEIGFWLSDGTLFAIYADTQDFLSKVSASQLAISLQIKFDTLDTENISFGDINVTNPPATESTAGISAFATQQEVDDGEIDNKSISPKTLKNKLVGIFNSNDTIPVGTILPYGGAIAPDGFFLAHGFEISRTIYAKLFAVYGTTYGTGDGSTTFNIPDLRGLFTRGLGGSSVGLGVLQQDAIRNIQGQIASFGTYSAAGTGAFSTVFNSASKSALAVGNSYIGVFDASNVVPTANENRPINMALNYIIKY